MPYIPPAYTNVKIFKNPKSKIYAYGYDKKGRKQIIYNAWFIEKQRKKRFRNVMSLRPYMKTLQKKIADTLKSPKDYTDKEVHICLILRLMMLCNFRIGNAKYLKDNGSYGLTTLEWKHLKFPKDTKTVKIEFVGKKGVVNKSICDDGQVVSLLKKLKKKADKPNVFSVSSKDVNAYIHEINTGMTAKDIRTWHANYLYVKFFNVAKKQGLTEKKSRASAIKQVAEALHNTPAVCKKSYLLPELIALPEESNKKKAEM